MAPLKIGGPEQAERHHGGWCTRLVPDEKGEYEPAPEQDTGDDGVHPTEIGRGGQTIGQSRKPEHRQKGAPPVHGPIIRGVAALGHVPKCQAEREQGNRHIDEENRAPRQGVHQPAPEDRS